MYDKVKNTVRNGLKFVAILYVAHRYLLPGQKVPKSVPGLEQPRLNLEPDEQHMLLDPATGKLALQGWEVNGEKYITDNSESASRALFAPEYSLARNRELNIFFLQTPEHYISVLSGAVFGNQHVGTSVSVVGVEPDNKESYMTEIKQEEMLVDVTVNKMGSKLHLDSEKLWVDFHRTEDKESHLKVNAREVDLQFDFSFDGAHESHFWSTPLADDKLTNFHTWKRAGIPIQPTKYTYKGKEYECGVNECLLTTDQYRGHHNYGMQFNFSLIQGVSELGDTFAIAVQEGIGAKYTAKDRASEDHISINGEVHKLDQSIMSIEHLPEKSDIWGQAWSVSIETTHDMKVFPDNHCKLVFHSDQTFREGVNLVVVALKREWQLGTFDVDCTIEGKQVKQTGVRGMFEHLWTRH